MADCFKSFLREFLMRPCCRPKETGVFLRVSFAVKLVESFLVSVFLFISFPLLLSLMQSWVPREGRSYIYSLTPVSMAKSKRPGSFPGQVDRRALGCRPRRLSARQLPPRLGRMERPLSRRRPAFLARPLQCLGRRLRRRSRLADGGHR